MTSDHGRESKLDEFAERVSLETLIDRVDELERELAASEYLGFHGTPRGASEVETLQRAFIRTRETARELVQSHGALVREVAALRERTFEQLRALETRVAAAERERVEIGIELWRQRRRVTSLALEVTRPLYKFLWRRLLGRPLSNPEDMRDRPPE